MFITCYYTWFISVYLHRILKCVIVVILDVLNSPLTHTKPPQKQHHHTSITTYKTKKEGNKIENCNCSRWLVVLLVGGMTRLKSLTWSLEMFANVYTRVYSMGLCTCSLKSSRRDINKIPCLFFPQSMCCSLVSLLRA